MDMSTNSFFITTEDGIEREMEILFTFEEETRNKKYVLFTNPEEETEDVFVGVYNDEGEITLLAPEDDMEEWEMIEEVFGAFMEEFENGDSEEEAED
ncbi:MAG: DUF1292 domain-containing protein [Anaerorhabdus sp.]